MHDPRVGRFFAIDPLFKRYPYYSPYQFSGNKVISYRELEGLEETEAFITAGTITKTTTELSKSYVDDLGRLVLDGAKEASKKGAGSSLGWGLGRILGTTFALLTDYMSPSYDPRIKTYGEVEGAKMIEYKNITSLVYFVESLYQPQPVSSVEELPAPAPVDVPAPVDKPQESDDKILLYRGVSSERTENDGFFKDMYVEAQFGVAIPNGLREGFKLIDAHWSFDKYALGDNYSIFTSWTPRKEVAKRFSNGTNGVYDGVIMSKWFDRKSVFWNSSDAAYYLDEGEFLVPGIVTGANVEQSPGNGG